MTETPTKRRRPSLPVLIVLVVLVGLLVVAGANAWQVWGTSWLARPAAAERVAELERDFGSADLPDDVTPVVEQPAIGDAAWVLRIERLGLAWPIVAGVDAQQLATGLGWYPGSALPGQVGNCALAGQRIGHGEPFSRLLELAVGDEVVVETEVAVFRYSVITAPADLTVSANDGWVLDPVPGRTEVEPTQAFLTLTTAEDLFPTADRSVGFAVLTATEAR